jgi:large subunit ribosomal protein L1
VADRAGGCPPRGPVFAVSQESKDETIGHGKDPQKRAEAVQKYDREKRYSLDKEATGLVKQMSYAKFDESVDVAVRLGVNPKHADQMVRGALVRLTAPARACACSCSPAAKRKEALEAGADFAGADELVARIRKGSWTSTVSVATPDMMGAVGKLGRILGPRGLMPNPTVGSVTQDVANAVRDAKGGKVEYRVDKAGVVHCRVGRVSFAPKALTENAIALIRELIHKRPATAKGIYLRSITLSSTMGPGVRVDTAAVTAEET